MECITAVAGKFAEFAVPPIMRQFGYVLHYNENLNRMKTHVVKLEGIKESVQHKVDEARNNGEEIKKMVQDWLNNADKTIAKAKKLIDNEGHAKAHCSMGHLPNLCTRHQLSRKTKKMLQDISVVIADEKFDKVSYCSAPQVPAKPFADYEALDSRTSKVNEIMMELKKPNIFVVAVYGMGGVGKTALVKELALQAKKDESFGAVLMATNITDSPDVKKIQDQLADKLNMKFNKKAPEGRAMQLCERIRKEKSVLVILDDIRSSLDLEEVGIPFGDVHKVCKLVVTSRDLNVLNREIGTDKEFRLEALLEEDSWKLFEKMAGDVVQEFNIKKIAVEVARRCAGLPLLIVTVAKALRKKKIYDWQNALNELEKFDKEGLHSDKRINSTLELSYNCLESEELKSLFLFIGSFGLDHLHSGELFSYYWGLCLYKHSRTLTQARFKYNKLIDDLKASSLLLESETEWIRIHDVFRSVAKSIASKTQPPTFGMKRYSEVKQWPGMDELRKFHQIILPWSYIYKLPEKLVCPKLELLQLENIGDYLEVPDDLFSGMRELKVVSLYGMMFTPSLPSSLRLLTKIKTLDLAGCVFKDISIVAELKSLEILSLERSDITELPIEIGQLTDLRMLNLANCSNLRFIPANLISSLTCLEELYMGNCFIQWNVKGRKGQSNNASLDELRNLSQLNALDIMIQDASVLPRDLQDFAKLERYNIFVGDMWKWSLEWAGGVSEPSRILKLADNRCSSICLDHEFSFLLNSAEDMCIAKIQCGKKFVYELNRHGFPQLKHLCIQDSTDLKYIINSKIYPTSHALPNLETLVLQNLFNLEEICQGPIPNQSFSKLRSFEVKGCDKLNNLLCYSIVTVLPQFREIKVSDCKMMTEIMSVQTSKVDKEMGKIMFPELRSLELECLPSLISLCAVTLTTEKSLKVRGENYDSTQCIPVALIDQKVEMPQLELLKLSNINSRKLWDDKPPSRSWMQNLRSLTIDGCGNIAYIFSSSVAREFVNLKQLAISNCQMLEKIFVSDGKLGSLPLSLEPCSDDEVIFPNLETLVVSHMEHLKFVWYNQLAPNSFGKLKELKIESCNEISNVIPSYVLDKFLNLETVTVVCCHAVEVVFETQGLKVDGGRQTRLEMHLRTLTLNHLPMLKHIWSGNPNESFKFQNLCLLQVTKCESLNYVLPLSVAKELQHLQGFYINECGVEIIVEQDEMADTVPILIFPELTFLSFRDLKQLQSFYRELNTLDFPALKDVDVLHCDKLVLFKPKSINYQEIVPADTVSLLSIEQVVHNKGELILNSKDVTMLCNGQLNDELIYTVTDLHLRCFHAESEKFPSGFLQRFINLKNLKVTCSFFTNIFLSGSECTGHSETIMKLGSLELIMLQKIERLVVNSCSRLENIFPSSVMFENLQKLEVGNCAGLESIMKPSTARSLQNLKELYIHCCGKIEEIVASDDVNDASELIFKKLEFLQLTNLPKLRSFCKGRHGFKFPLLRILFVEDCPVIETFSHGVLNAPRLREVREEDEWHWNGDVNTTIKKLVAKMNSKDDCDCPQNLIEGSSG